MFCSACAQETATAPCAGCGADPLLQGRYRLERRLGQGQSGTTWGGVRLADGLPVALKEAVVRRENAEEIQRRLEREAAILRQLHHPSLPTFVEQLETSSGRTRSCWLVMELVEGADLQRGLATHRYSEDEVLVVIDELCEVLTYLHGRSPPVIHRDLKPSNVIRSTSGRLVLVDFGSVRDVLSGELGGQTVAGTFGFMAPEQFAGDAVPQTDLYGLGALAVALLTREDPAKLHDAQGRLVWRGRAAVSAPTGRLLEALLAPAPAQRPASAEEVRRQIRERDVRPEVSLLSPPARRPHRAAKVAAFAGLGTLALALGGVLSLMMLGTLVGLLWSRSASLGSGNVEACTSYVEAFNDAPCSAVHLDPRDLCPPQLDEHPCDMSGYYACMSEAISCHGDFLDISRQVSCHMPDCR
jgi:serine/threonine protein kinase